MCYAVIKSGTDHQGLSFVWRTAQSVTFSTHILLLWHTEMVTTQFGTVSLVGICGGFLVGTKIPASSSEDITKSSSFSPSLETASSSSGTNVPANLSPSNHTMLFVSSSSSSRHAFWMLIYLFLVCICPHCGDKCRTVDMACQFWLARRKSTSIQTLKFIQEIFCGCFWAIGLLEYLVYELVQRHQTLLLLCSINRNWVPGVICGRCL